MSELSDFIKFSAYVVGIHFVAGTILSYFVKPNKTPSEYYLNNLDDGQIDLLFKNIYQSPNKNQISPS